MCNFQFFPRERERVDGTFHKLTCWTIALDVLRGSISFKVSAFIATAHLNVITACDNDRFSAVNSWHCVLRGWCGKLRSRTVSRLGYCFFSGKVPSWGRKDSPENTSTVPFFFSCMEFCRIGGHLTCESASIILSPWLRPASTSCLHLKMHEHEHEREAAFSHLRRIQIKRIRCQTNPYRAIQAIAHLNCGRTCSVCGS